MRMRADKRTAVVARAGDMAVLPRGGQSGPAVVFVFVPVAVPIDGGGGGGMVGSLHPPPKPTNSQLPFSPPLPSASQVRMLACAIDMTHEHSLDLVGITLVLDLPR